MYCFSKKNVTWQIILNLGIRMAGRKEYRKFQINGELFTTKRKLAILSNCVSVAPYRKQVLPVSRLSENLFLTIAVANILLITAFPACPLVPEKFLQDEYEPGAHPEHGPQLPVNERQADEESQKNYGKNFSYGLGHGAFNHP